MTSDNYSMPIVAWETLCRCGSGLQRYDLTDAAGIFCCYVCEDCEAEHRAGYRADIFTDPEYECTEDKESAS